MAKLILKHEGVNLRDYVLSDEVTTLGRRADNHIQIDDAAISGRHAQFIRQKSEYLDDHFDYYVEDLGSTNGTKVNDEKIDKHLLKNGDIVQVGKHVFSFDSSIGDELEQTAIYLPDN